jgi:hypothetical protein
MGKMRGACRVLVGKSQGERPHVRLRRRWEDDIRMILKKRDGRAWTELIWLRPGTCGGLL